MPTHLHCNKTKYYMHGRWSLGSATVRQGSRELKRVSTLSDMFPRLSLGGKESWLVQFQTGLRASVWELKRAGWYIIRQVSVPQSGI